MSEAGAQALLQDAGDPLQVVAAWRAQGAQRWDPVRFRFIEALARRAAGLQGAARRVVDDRLTRVLADYRARAEQRAEQRAAGHLEAGPGQAPGGPLADLLREMAAERAAGSAADGPGDGTNLSPGPNELKALSQHRATWSRLSVDRRLNQSRAKMPGNAGPLNSHALVLRSLNLMRELSPHYLSRFMSHVDSLLWLEQANGGHAVLQSNVLGADGEKPRKSGRGRGKAG